MQTINDKIKKSNINTQRSYALETAWMKKILFALMLGIFSFGASGCDLVNSLCSSSPLIGCEGSQL